MKYTKKDVIIVVIVVIVVGGASFYAGSHMKGRGAATDPTNRLRAGGIQRGSRTGADGFAGGEVISKDEASITIKLRDGGSKIVFLTPQTPIMKSISGSISDVNTGATVMVTGKTNPDGSIAADSVQIRPSTPPSVR